MRSAISTRFGRITMPAADAIKTISDAVPIATPPIAIDSFSICWPLAHTAMLSANVPPLTTDVLREVSYVAQLVSETVNASASATARGNA
jgi:hypothetical protein